MNKENEEEKESSLQKEVKDLEKIYSSFITASRSVSEKLDNQKTSDYRDINKALSEYTQKIIQYSKGPLKPNKLLKLLVDDVLGKQCKEPSTAIRKYSNDVEGVGKQLSQVLDEIRKHAIYIKNQKKLDLKFIRASEKFYKAIEEEDERNALSRKKQSILNKYFLTENVGNQRINNSNIQDIERSARGKHPKPLGKGEKSNRKGEKLSGKEKTSSRKGEQYTKKEEKCSKKGGKFNRKGAELNENEAKSNGKGVKFNGKREKFNKKGANCNGKKKSNVGKENKEYVQLSFEINNKLILNPLEVTTHAADQIQLVPDQIVEPMSVEDVERSISPSSEAMLLGDSDESSQPVSVTSSQESILLDIPVSGDPAINRSSPIDGGLSINGDLPINLGSPINREVSSECNQNEGTIPETYFHFRGKPFR